VTLLQPDSPFMRGDRLALNKMLEQGYEVSMRVTGYVSDEYTDAVVIEQGTGTQTLRFRARREFPHVTLSVADGHTAEEANNLKRAEVSRLIEPLLLTGKLEVLTRKSKEPAELCPHHFPNGTVFRIHEDSVHVRFDSLERGPDTFTVVNGIVRNGIDSYVLKTGVMRSHTGEEAFNIDHVAEVIERGKGPLVIDHGWYGFQPNEKFAEDKDRGQWVEPTATWRPRKGYYCTIAIRALLHCELQGIAKNGMMLDFAKIFNSLEKQTWCRAHKVGPWLEMLDINKKRLRRWLKANINRFLMPMAPALRAEEQEQRLDYERDMEAENAEWERTHPEPIAADQSQQGSHYDNYDNDADGRYADFLDLPLDDEQGAAIREAVDEDSRERNERSIASLEQDMNEGLP
jgi:hypothetical protein